MKKYEKLKALCAELNCQDYPVRIYPIEFYEILFPYSYKYHQNEILEKNTKYIVSDDGLLYGFYDNFKAAKKGVKDLLNDYKQLGDNW